MAVTKWERFGDDTWINVDHVEVLRVEEQEDGRWQLIAAFTSGRSYPVGSHEDRELLADCTDMLLRGQISDRLRVLTGPDEDGAGDAVPEATGQAIPDPAEGPVAGGQASGAVIDTPSRPGTGTGTGSGMENDSCNTAVGSPTKKRRWFHRAAPSWSGAGSGR